MGINPVGDEALREIGTFWARPCLDEVS
jgi:hypothetical protein